VAIIRELVTLLGYKVDDTGRDQYNKGIDQTKQKQQSLTGAFLKANIIMGVANKALGAAFGFVKDSVIGATAETERYRVALGTMMGDQEKANKIIHDLDYGEGLFEGVRLSDFYGTAAAIGGLQNMVTFGMEAEKAGDVLARLGDIAQGDSEAFASMSNAMGQVFAKGKADSVQLKQFASKGFDVVGEVAKQTGKSREEIQKTGVSYEQTAAALRALTDEGGKYHGMLSKQMNTLGGILKQFASLKAAMAEAIGFGINDDLKDMLKYILDIVRAGQEAFVGKFVKFLKEVIHWIFQVIIMWEVLQYRLEDMGAFEILQTFFEDLKHLAGYVLTAVMNLVVAVGKAFIEAFKTAYAFIRPILNELGPLIQKVANFAVKGIGGLIPIIQMLRPPLTVIGSVLGVIIKGLGGIIDFLSPLAPIIVGIIAIIKIWTFVQWLLNAAMAANPIGLIVIAVVAAVALIVGLVMVVIKNWSKIADFFIWLGGVIADAFLFVFRKIGEFFVFLAEKIKQIWNGIVDFFKKWGEVILQVLAVIIFGIPGMIAVAVYQIIKHWDVIGPKVKAVWDWICEKISEAIEFIKNIFASIGEFFSGVWDGVKNIASKAWTGIKNIAGKSIDNMKKSWGGFTDWYKNKTAQQREVTVKVWSGIKDWFSGLWSGIVNTAGDIWDGIKSVFTGVINSIKNIWNGIIGFFSGLWEAMKEGPTAAIEYIKNAFLGLFNSLQEKLLGFVNKIKDAWNGIKGFFGGVAEGVGNFFTGGGGSQPQPAYAGASQSAVANRVGQTSSYAYNNARGGDTNVNANTSINVNVPSGTSKEQSEAIARQIDAQFNAKLSGSINSSRANIPSPEARRN